MAAKPSNTLLGFNQSFTPTCKVSKHHVSQRGRLSSLSVFRQIALNCVDNPKSPSIAMLSAQLAQYQLFDYRLGLPVIVISLELVRSLAECGA